MRDFPWRYVFISIPIIGVAAGLQYLVRNVAPESTTTESTVALKPSTFKKAQESRAIASHDDRMLREGRKTLAEREAEELADRDYADRETREIARKPKAEPIAEAPEHADPLPARNTAGTATPEVAKEISKELKADVPTEPVRDPLAERYGFTRAETQPVANISGDVCTAVEYRGDGADAKLTTEDWNAVTRQFQAVRGELLAWLNDHKKQFPDKSVEVMQKQLRTMTIQRPPLSEEPDLNWRGIAVYGHDREGAPQIKIGSGFVKLVRKQPQRARFELARLVAQGWAPCELQKKDGGTPWEPLLKCMGMDPAAGCGFGTYSENGWAVSSVLAQNIAPAGCAVQAFKDAGVAGCVKRIPFPLGAGATADSGTREFAKRSGK